MPASPVAPVPVAPVPVAPVPVSPVPVEPPDGPAGPVGPGVPPSDPGPLLNGPSALVDGPVDSPVGLFEPPDGPDPLLPSPDVLLGPMLKLLTGPSPLLLLLDPVPPPIDVVWVPVWAVVVEWRVIVVADSCIGWIAIEAVGVENGFPGALGPWCVFASAVAAVPNAIHIAAVVIVPVMTTVRVHARCWTLCLPTKLPLCNTYLHTLHSDSGAIIHPPGAIFTLTQQIAWMK